MQREEDGALSWTEPKGRPNSPLTTASLGTCVPSLGLGFLNCEMGVTALPGPISKGQ